MSVRVVVCHRSALIREVLRILGAAAEVYVVGEATTPEQLVESCREERPAVTLAEAEFETGGKIETFLPELLATGTRLIVICDDPDPERLTGILERGVTGYLRSDAAPTAVIESVQAVAAGAAVLDPYAAGTILEQWRRLRDGSNGMPGGLPALTARETEVLAAMADGLATKAIARRLDMAVKTVENHKTRVFDKLGVSSQPAAVSYAIAHGLLTAMPRA